MWQPVAALRWMTLCSDHGTDSTLCHTASIFLHVVPATTQTLAGETSAYWMIYPKNDIFLDFLVRNEWQCAGGSNEMVMFYDQSPELSWDWLGGSRVASVKTLSPAMAACCCPSQAAHPSFPSSDAAPVSTHITVSTLYFSGWITGLNTTRPACQEKLSMECWKTNN